MVFQMHRTQTLLGDYIGTAQLTCSAVKHGILLYRQRNDKKPIYIYTVKLRLEAGDPARLYG